jgi:uncharacterized membrane protein YeaQ/YmgE (transglycosylase-associated protein family)
MKSYNGVAILSKVPFTAMNVHHRCGKEDCRHIEVALDVGGDPILLDNLYIPAGGDIPDPEANDKFAHKLDFYREMAGWYAERKPGPRQKKGLRRIAVGDLNVAPLEHDVWNHKQLLKIVSHTPIEVELFGKMMAANGLDRRAAPLRAGRARSSIRGGATATTTGAPPTAAAGSTISWRARRYRARSAATISTPTCATGSSLPTTCRCWRRSRRRGIHDMMTFIGILLIGLVVGLLARFLTPGPTPRGILVTIVIGIVGFGDRDLWRQGAGPSTRTARPPASSARCFGAIVLIVLSRLLQQPLADLVEEIPVLRTPGGSGWRCQRATSSAWLARM